jgi:hypothetical protein
MYDVEKCFDSLWLQECINDNYKAGLQNDKLPPLFLENSNAKVAVKTSNGISKRIDIKNIVMQGYKGAVAVPPLCMVDDILAVQECSKDSVQINSVINSFIELKKTNIQQQKVQQNTCWNSFKHLSGLKDT